MDYMFDTGLGIDSNYQITDIQISNFKTISCEIKWTLCNNIFSLSFPPSSISICLFITWHIWSLERIAIAEKEGEDRREEMECEEF